jgi:hypothetical protein
MNMNRKQLSLERLETELVLRAWNEETPLRAYGATCPMPRCEALAVTYEPADSVNSVVGSSSGCWEFVCSQCGAEFMATKEDLLFQAVPREWLFSQLCHA